MAFLSIVFKGGIMLGAPLAFALMAHTGFEGAWGPITAEQGWWIRLCASLVPVATLLIPIALMWNFPLNATRHEAIRRDLQARQTAEGAR
jgi:Na+/melibiose symporter-like transporter